MDKKSPSVHRNENRIILNTLNHPSCVSDFLRAIYDGLQRGYEDFIISSKATAIFPNACVPIVGIIEYYNVNKKIDFTYDLELDNYLLKCGFKNGIYKNSTEIAEEYNPFDKVYVYDTPDQVATLTKAYIEYISRSVQCAEGVLDGLTWCFNEVMDNVLVHSEVNKGFIMAQYHPNTQHIAVCIYDYGIGIFNSLKKSKHKPSSPLDAISISIQEGVGDGQGQGNGLYGLYEIVQKNSGRLTITSGSASIMYKEYGDIHKFSNIPFLDLNNNGTTVDFQLDLNKNVDIKAAFKSIGGYDGFDLRIDNMIEDDESIRYDVFDNCHGTATREAGKYLRNDVYNIWTRKKSIIFLDFTNVKSVSSSFIDEFVAKLIIQFGIVSFNRVFRIIGMNDTIRFLCDRSTYMRIYEQWNELK